MTTTKPMKKISFDGGSTLYEIVDDSLRTTISGYGDIVTHDASEFLTSSDLSDYQKTETAVTHTKNTVAGNSTTPIYVNSSGVATALSYTLAKSVPADAVFTDTHYNTGLYAGTGTAANATTTNGNTKLTITDDNTVRSSITIQGSGNTSVASDDSGVITISSTAGSDTKNTAGATDTASKIYLIGATAQDANPQTYSQDTAFVDTNGRVNSAAPASDANDTTVATTKWVKDQGYTDSVGTVTSVNNVSPINGNVTISIPSEVTESTVSGWGFTKTEGTVTSVNNVSPTNGNVTLSIPTITDTYDSSSSNGMSGVAVASAISGKADSSTSLSGYGITDAYTKTEIDGMVSSVYKPAGSVAFASLPTLASGVLGNVYNVTDSFTTDSRFVEGASKTYPANTNVVVVNTGTSSSPTYQFDVLAGFVDLSGYVTTDIEINGKTLSGNINLTASDVGALADSTTIPTTTDSVTSASTAALTSGGAYTNLITAVAADNTDANKIVVTKAGSNTTITINDVAHATAADSATSATTASALGSSNVGDSTTPVYLVAGAPTAMSYTLAKSVPADAVFTDTTYSAFTGADGTSAGASGLVPAPTATDNTKFLKGDGTWGSISIPTVDQTYNASSTNAQSGTAVAEALSNKTLAIIRRWSTT